MRYETLPPGVRKEKEICAAAHMWTVGIDSTFSRRKDWFFHLETLSLKKSSNEKFNVLNYEINSMFFLTVEK